MPCSERKSNQIRTVLSKSAQIFEVMVLNKLYISKTANLLCQ